MPYTVSPAASADVPAVLELIRARIRWMDEQGLRQWNVTRYLEVYPASYFQALVQEGTLYLLRRSEDGAPAGAAALFFHDARWTEDAPARYVHHLVTTLGASGAGDALLDFCAEEARRGGAAWLRLDCQVENEMLNRYYEQRGYVPAGTFWEHDYHGLRRQKAL